MTRICQKDAIRVRLTCRIYDKIIGLGRTATPDYIAGLNAAVRLIEEELKR